MNIFASTYTSDSDSASSCSSTSEMVPKRSEYKILNSKKRFNKFNDKYNTGIIIFHRLDEQQLASFVRSVRTCSTWGRKIGVVDVSDRWCQDISPASCKDHPYVQWYSQGKRVAAPAEVRFQYAKLIGGILGFRKIAPVSPVVSQSHIEELLSHTLFVAPQPFVTELGQQKSFGELGQLLQSIDESVLYSLVESDLDEDSFSGDTPGAGFSTATVYMFKGASSVVESGQTAAGEKILGIIASACISQICEESPKDDKESGKRWTAVCDHLLEVLPQLGARTIIDIAFRILAELKTSGSTPTVLNNFLPMLLDALGAVGTVEIVSGSDTNGGGMGIQDDDDQNGPDEAGGDNNNITRTGGELMAYWVNSACSYRWDPHASVAVCALFREIALAENMVARVGQRMLDQLKHVELTELPAMVYQLLLFARYGAKRDVLSGIFSFFDSIETAQAPDETDVEAHKKWRELGDIEGTIMLNFSYNVKQDFELGDALIAYVRERTDGIGGGALSTFSFACLLALARIHRFEDEVTKLLRTTIMKGIHDSMSLEATVWVQPYLPPPAHNAQNLLGAVVSRAAYGWDQVTQTLVQLSLNIIDSSVGLQRRNVYSAGACAEARRICANALRSAFSAHEFVRAEVLEQILNRVMFLADGHTHFIELLRDLVADDPDLVRPYASRLIDMFDSISTLTPTSVEQLLSAAAPLFLEDASLRSSLALVLRKILFAHSFDDRRTALSGLSVLADRISAALDAFQQQSQNHPDPVSGRASRRIDELLSALLEIISLLRRCLTQQPEVRAMSYDKIAQLLDIRHICRNNVLLDALYEIFRIEFSKYYCSDRNFDSPINILMCVNPSTHKVVMPIANFLHCFAKLTLARSAFAQSGSGSLGSHDAWVDICERFSRVNIEDFELDPAGDYSLSDPNGLRNYNTALLVIGCLDTSLEYALLYGVRSLDSGSTTGARCALDNPALAIDIFSKFNRFADILYNRCVKDDKKRVIGSITDLSTMTLPTLVQILRQILPEYNGRNIDNADSRMALWSANNRLVWHLLDVTLSRMQRRPLIGFSAGVSSTLPPVPDVSTVLEVAYIVYAGALVYYASARPDEEVELPLYLRPKGNRGRTVLQLCSDILAACIGNLTARGIVDLLPATLMRPSPALFTATAAPDGACADMVVLVGRLRNSVTVLLAQQSTQMKDVVSILTTTELLTSRLAEIATGHSDDSQREQAAECLKMSAKWSVALVDKELRGDIGFMKAVIALLTRCQPFSQGISTRQNSWSLPPPAVGRSSDGNEMAAINLIVVGASVAARIIYREGDDSADEIEDQEPDLEIYNQRTIPKIVTAVTLWIRAELHQINWAVGQLKRCVQVELSEQDASEPEDLVRSISAERRICLRLIALSHIMMRLLKTRWQKLTNDVVVRTFQEVHKTFGLLTRTKTACRDLPITEAYIDALSLICSELNTCVYSMLIEKYGNNSSVSRADGIKDGETKGKGKGKGKESLTGGAKNKSQQIMKDSTLVSSLIFQIETTEKHVGNLGKKFSTSLAHHLKRSTARDFRIRESDIPAPPKFRDGRYSYEDSSVGETNGNVEEDEDEQAAEDVEMDDGGSPETEIMDLIDLDPRMDEDEQNEVEDEDDESAHQPSKRTRMY
ncbi:hypothetical protein GGI15_004472 [Coemansia interrupta]|uniref:Uncharacterized protein n=1 Tax=Coemansia interrupta TaxID=1126814 RepID=A0A9W8H7H2_9FUNG|nr:hypothetical protein GGI15_004472 [Coemansia interrupta]